jgi:serine/threonine protein kinase
MTATLRTCLQCSEKTEGLFCPIDGMATIVEGKKPSDQALDVGAVFAGRYRVTGVLGQGGMGAVYAATHTGTGQSVAVKTLLIDPTSDMALVRRFFHEAKMTAGLQHPNTIRVFDFGQANDGTFFLAMECLRGETLSDRLQRLAQSGKTLGELDACQFAVDVLKSLHEAHKAGLVHRDLKPANIFLHDLGTGETIVKVLDFGIAKHNDTQLTKAGTALGTPSYMSPEQIRGETVDGRADLYSLGVILYCCAAGELPFPGDSSYTVMMKHVMQTPPDLRKLERIDVHTGFADVVEKALAKKADERFRDANTMREALETVAASIKAARKAVPDEPTLANAVPLHGLPGVEVSAAQVRSRAAVAESPANSAPVPEARKDPGVQRNAQPDVPSPPPTSVPAEPSAGPDERTQASDAFNPVIKAIPAHAKAVPGSTDAQWQAFAGQHQTGERPAQPAETEVEPKPSIAAKQQQKKGAPMGAVVALVVGVACVGSAGWWFVLREPPAQVGGVVEDSPPPVAVAVPAPVPAPAAAPVAPPVAAPVAVPVAVPAPTAADAGSSAPDAGAADVPTVGVLKAGESALGALLGSADAGAAKPEPDAAAAKPETDAKAEPAKKPDVAKKPKAEPKLTPARPGGTGGRPGDSGRPSGGGRPGDSGRPSGGGRPQ